MQKFPSISLNGSYRMTIMDQKEYTAVAEEFDSIEVLERLGRNIFPATVPGNFELDMHAAGLIPDPFYASTTLDLLKYETYHVFYSGTFDYKPEFEGLPILRFEGLDTFADIYLNGVLVGHTENMLIPHEMDVTEALNEGENELFVHIYPTCVEARNYDLGAADMAMRYTFDSLYVRKAAHMFGWDIMPRAVSAGIWRPVSLQFVPEKYVREAYLMTQSIAEDYSFAKMQLHFNFEIGDDAVYGYSVRIEGSCGDSRFEAEDVLWFTQGKLEFKVENPKLWWPVGRGEQNLYDVKVTLLKDGKAVAEDNIRTGIRTTKLIMTDTIDEEGNGEFCFVINGERVFIKGSNWIPADAYHSRDHEREPRMLDLWTEIGCNAMRVWGGGVYEDEQFYNICDEKGIIVWMDFCMGCGSYPQTRDFLDTLYEEAEIVIKLLRHHPSICLWAGDNENDYFAANCYDRDPNKNRITREAIPEAVRRHDPTRPYLASSPYVSQAAYDAGMGLHTPEQHLWGPRDYFKGDFYRNANAVFASEMGYHGCPSPASVRKFIAPENVWTDYKDNRDWFTHAASPDSFGPYSYRNDLMRKHVKTLWDIDHCDSLEQFATASQISQAEAKKYFVERFRCRKWKRTGVIWWNIIDGWPQFSDAIVDYYFTKKLAFSYIQRSQTPLCLMFDEPENGSLKLIGSNDTRNDLTCTYQVYRVEEGVKTQILSGTATVNADTSACIALLPYTDGAQDFYYIEWQAGEFSGTNHFLAGRPPYSLETYLKNIRALGYDKFEGFEKE